MRPALALLGSVACLLASGASAAATTIDLPATAAGRIEGGGSSVAAAGDVNGDGYGDLLIGAEFRRGRGSHGEQAGSAFVLFGQPRLEAVNLALPGPAGFRIIGAKGGDSAGAQVAGAGDFNADGLADVLVSAPYAQRFWRPAQGQRLRHTVMGAAYLVYGSRSHRTVDLARLGARGVVIKGIGDGDVAGAGDVNGDGRADIVVGDLQTYDDGGAHVIFGGTTARTLDVARLGARGISMRGAPGDVGAGQSVAGLGDVNGDRLADIALGAPWSLGRPVPPDGREPYGRGAAYVVFGRASSGPMRLDRLGRNGFRIEPSPTSLNTGATVAGPGDVNGDGLADVAIGAPLSVTRSRSGQLVEAGSASLVLGKPSSSRVRLGRLGSGGFEIRGDPDTPGAGSALAPAGDVNRDGLADLLVGSVDPDGPGRRRDDPPTAAHTVFGQSTPKGIELRRLGRAAGLTLRGLEGDSLGRALAATDLDGDGSAELVLGTFSCIGGSESIDRAGKPFGAEPRRREAVYVHSASIGQRPAAGITTGSARRDVLTGTGGDDRIAARGGPDTVRGAAGGDCLYGDEGDDTLAGGKGGDALFAGAGDDAAAGDAGNDALKGGPGRDTLIGGDGPDGLDGGAGDDRLSGGAGPDELNDFEGGNDKLEGGSGDDAIEDGLGSSLLRGGAGDDELSGGEHSDRLYGGEGADRLFGDEASTGPLEPAGNDRIHGGAGDDRLSGGPGRDLLDGGPGDDVVDARDGHVDVVRCGAGGDLAHIDRSDRHSGCERLSHKPYASWASGRFRATAAAG